MILSLAIYSCLFLLPLALGFFQTRRPTKIKKTLSIILPILLFYFLLVAKSNTVGTDTNSYLTFYQEIQNGRSLSTFPDKGFYFLMYACAKIHLSFRFFQGIFYFLCMVCLFFFFSFTSKTPWFSIVVFFSSALFSMAFSGLRQFGSISFCLLAIAIYEKFKNRKIRFLSLIPFLFACTLHKSGVIFILFFLFSFAKGKNINYWLCSSIYLFFLLDCSVFHFFLNSFYDMGYPITGVYLGFPKKSLFLFCVFTFFWYCSFGKKTRYAALSNLSLLDDFQGKQTSPYLLALLTSASIMAFSSCSPYFTRFAFFFEYGGMILFPKTIENFKTKKGQHFVETVGVILCVMLYFYEILTNPTSISKYSFFFLKG